MYIRSQDSEGEKERERKREYNGVAGGVARDKDLIDEATLREEVLQRLRTVFR
jgi:hypothetical protein